MQIKNINYYLVQVDLCKQLVGQLDASIVPDKDLIIAGALAKSGAAVYYRYYPDYCKAFLAC
jgi:hypothetical protein